MDAAAAISLVKDPRLRKGLQWFAEHSGETLKVPLEGPDGVFLHGPQGGGIYVPKDSPYVLSLKSSWRANDESMYADPDPHYLDASRRNWVTKYHHVIPGPKGNAPIWKNARAINNMVDCVPVGVFREVQGDRHEKVHRVLGVALITSYDTRTGYFTLETLPSAVGEPKGGYHAKPSTADLRNWKLVQQRIREGQASFRSKLSVVYGQRCAVTGYDIEEALEAAHIIPYRGKHTNITPNGILLRADIHALFDAGHLGITPVDHKILLSERAKHSKYGELHLRPLALPDRPSERPMDELLQAHLSTWGAKLS